MVNVEKAHRPFYPPKKQRKCQHEVSRWLKGLSKERPEMLQWATSVVGDEKIYSAVFELVCWYKIPAHDLLDFLREQKIIYAASSELRASLRAKGSKWETVEKAVINARTETEPFLGALRNEAAEIEKRARVLARYFIKPAGHRPREVEISECKQEILAFLKRRKVREVNEYGWVMLYAVFGKKWRAGTGKDQIEAFRDIPASFTGRIRNKKDAMTVMEKAKVELFRMEEQAKK